MIIEMCHTVLPLWKSTYKRLYDAQTLTQSNKQLPSGGSVRGGLRQYMWYPRSQSSQNSSWSYNTKENTELNQMNASNGFDGS